VWSWLLLKRRPFCCRRWGINVAEYLFLRRDWARDQQHIATFLGSFAPNDRMLWVLFPEGTDMEPHKVPVSQVRTRPCPSFLPTSDHAPSCVEGNPTRANDSARRVRSHSHHPCFTWSFN
jgi:hypothetical protein